MTMTKADLVETVADAADVPRKQADEVVQVIEKLGRRAWSLAYDLAETEGLDELAASVLRREIDPYSAVDSIIEQLGVAKHEPERR